MKLLIAGDTHSNPVHISEVLIPAALRAGADHIFVVGDFGFWPRNENGHRFLTFLENALEANDITLYWLDGNHEDHAALKAIGQSPATDLEGFWTISKHIRYSPRGHRWNWYGVDFLSLGGAYSIDRNMRVIGKSWFWEEMIEDDEVEKASEGGKVDIMLTHDIPAGIPMAEIMASHGRGFSIINESYKNTMQVRKVVDAVEPRLLFHGHYHLRYMRQLDNDLTTVVGLCCDGSGPDSYIIIDLATWDADK